MTIEETLAQRNNTHGSFVDNGYIMQMLKYGVRNFKCNGKDSPSWEYLRPYQREALDMICHKVGRILSGNPDETDHWHDIAGYAILVERILKGEVK